MSVYMFLVYVTVWSFTTHQLVHGILYPYESETREVKSLDGLWTFCTTPRDQPQDVGFSDKWFNTEYHEDKMSGEHCQLMPVPASYNDIPTDSSVRDFIGWAWYRRTHFVPRRWSEDNLKIFVRFGSVHYHAVVWMNGQQVGEHVGGHLPFQLEITSALHYGTVNILTVAVNNTLTNVTLPQMQIHHPNDTSRYPTGYITYSQKFDFFNYAGIHRPVFLLALPSVHIDDITLITDVKFESDDQVTGIIQFSVEHSYQGSEDDVSCGVSISTQGGSVIHHDITSCTSEVTIRQAKLWWPRFSHAKPGYLYTFEVSLVIQGKPVDVYRLPFGIRTVTWNKSDLMINRKPVYLRGFGMHEDSNLRGKGLDLVHLVRDFELINWLGANSLRTSHYPYSEETMNMADKYGILVIAESPACTIDSFGDEILSHHKTVLNELIARDKNHPSIIAWSIANEPYSDLPQADRYFGTLADLIRSQDSTRAVTFVSSRRWNNDRAVQHMDFICVNRYAAWYSDSGQLPLIERQTVEELKAWHDRWQRPIIMSEYGAGSLSGFHKLPAVMWTEDYQILTLRKHFPAFDSLRLNGQLAGEMIWNFADFNTPQEYIRPGGCMKGLMTRDRQPKAAAHLARWRYWKLAQNTSGFPVPQDLLYL